MKKKSKIIKIEDIFPLAYGTDFAKELIAKSNELFNGTPAEIPMQDNGKVTCHMLKRLALITTLYKDKQLQSNNLYPITPLESELALKENKFNPRGTWEDLALILYDINEANKKEAQALYDSIKKYQKELGLSKSDLKEKLLIINAGIAKDSNLQYGIKPIVLPGLTEAYIHPVLEKTGENHKFEYGLENGLPSIDKLENGNRTLYMYMPSDNKNIGLRVLYRYRDLGLDARYEGLAVSDSSGRVNFARRASRENTQQILEEVLSYSERFVPSAAKEEYKKGLRKLLNE